MSEKIPFGKAFIVGRELEYIAQATAGGHLSGDGAFTARCQDWLVNHLGCRHALLTHSCTAALELAAIASGISEGDEVVMPSYTFVSTANAFVLRGATPVFVDIRADTINLDETLLEAAITPRTRAIAPVHYAGVGCDMDRIGALAERHGLLVIEDAAQALLARYRGKPLGAVGDLGCLSFHNTKNVICGEGGALLFRDERFIERAEIVREKGTNRKAFFRGEVDKYTWIDLGSSYLPSELNAAFLFAQLESAERINRHRIALCAAYRERLASLERDGRLKLPGPHPDCEDTGHIFHIRTRTFEEREGLRKHLLADNIQAVSHYVPLHSSPFGQRHGRVSGPMRETDLVADTLLRLPLYFEMNESHVDRVAQRVQDYFSAAPGP